MFSCRTKSFSLTAEFEPNACAGLDKWRYRTFCHKRAKFETITSVFFPLLERVAKLIYKILVGLYLKVLVNGNCLTTAKHILYCGLFITDSALFYMLLQSGMLTFQITNQNTPWAQRRKMRTLMRDLRVRSKQTHSQLIFTYCS